MAPRVLQEKQEGEGPGGRGTRTSITGPGPGERELPLLRLLFSIVHDYDTGPCRGGCERDRMSHTEASFARDIGVERSPEGCSAFRNVSRCTRATEIAA